MNETHGRPEDLPFDLRGNKTVLFNPNDPQALVAELTSALRLILAQAEVASGQTQAAKLELRRKVQSQEGEIHRYRVEVWVANTGQEILSDWSTDVTFPLHLLLPNAGYPNQSAAREAGFTSMHQTQAGHSRPLRPGDERQLIGIDYRITEALVERLEALPTKEIRARFFVGSKQVAATSMKTADLHEF